MIHTAFDVLVTVALILLSAHQIRLMKRLQDVDTKTELLGPAVAMLIDRVENNGADLREKLRRKMQEIVYPHSLN